jgi:two-component system response regulator ResD
MTNRVIIFLESVQGGIRMSQLKVLVADDNPNVREIIRLYFERNQIQMVEAGNGKEAIELAETEQPDVIILDIMMPLMDGFDVCREIRRNTNVPIIMLTAKDEEIDRVLGLEIGADDYVTKPFSPREIVARIKAILRRTSAEPEINSKNSPKNEIQSYDFDKFNIQVQRREVKASGENIFFRPKEFDLLLYFIENTGHVLTREQLLQSVWGYDYYGDIRTVDVHVKKVREKLKKYKIECIHTIWGVGYRFEMLAETEQEDA